MSQRLLRLLVPLALAAASAAAGAIDFEVEVPLARKASGNFYVEGRIGDTPSSFLVDTGSGLTTVNEKLFKALSRTSPLERVGRMAARLANGRIAKVNIYRVEHFRLGTACDLGAVDVAVLSRDGANILGLDTLTRAAPFAFHLDPPRLVLSSCANDGTPLAAH